MNNDAHSGAAPAQPGTGAAYIDVEYFTDPLCGWSWAFEAPWRALRWRYPARIRWHYRMAGLIPKWEGYRDEEANVSRPAQMGPHWLYRARSTGQPMHTRIWVNDPPESSMPSCLAVKTAALHGGAAAELYLRRLREAIALEERNIAQEGVLLASAQELAAVLSTPTLIGSAGRSFDAVKFEQDWYGEAAGGDLREDLRETRYLQIQQLPALVFHGPAVPPFIVSGYRSLPQLERALAHSCGEALPPPREGSVRDFVEGWPGCTAVEIATGIAQSVETVQRELRELVERGDLSEQADLYRVAPALLAPLRTC